MISRPEITVPSHRRSPSHTQHHRVAQQDSVRLVTMCFIITSLFLHPFSRLAHFNVSFCFSSSYLTDFLPRFLSDFVFDWTTSFFFYLLNHRNRSEQDAVRPLTISLHYKRCYKRCWPIKSTQLVMFFWGGGVWKGWNVSNYSKEPSQYSRNLDWTPTPRVCICDWWQFR